MPIIRFLAFCIYFCPLCFWYTGFCEEQFIPSSCIGLSDGYYYLKLLDGDEYPIVYTKCSNGYLILDPSLDQDIKLYFHSFEMYHIAVGGPSNQYALNWDDWFLPSTHTKYGISPDCATCETEHKRQLYPDETVYMMTGSMFGCFWGFPHYHQYDQDFDTYQCYYDAETTQEDTTQEDTTQKVGEFPRYPLTDVSIPSDWDRSGLCAFNVRSASLNVPLMDESCAAGFDINGVEMEYRYHLKPSIGTNGKHCVCSQSNAAEMIAINAVDLQKKQQQIEESFTVENVEIEDEDASASTQMVYYVFQSDFEDGTFRIIKPGRYVLMEDIVFNPNRPIATSVDTNADMRAWRPHYDQQELYPGAAQFGGPYFMGFWAAITIETNHVILDLNDHSIAMDKRFYYQQRWFSIISLTSQYYLPGQGIGFFGSNPSFASNVIIKDGTLGLTSHHCIHGNFNKNILIEHIICRDFETHGIQLNGFDRVTIRNVEIGPSSSIAFLRGEYSHARALLPRLQNVADENPDKTIRFHQRDPEGVTMSDLTEELIRKMDLIYDYVYHGNEPVFNSVEEQWEWNDILELFYNPSGIPNGASVYGIYLNTNGENTMSFDLNVHSFSSHAILDNVQIHHLRHKMIEYVRVSSNNMNPFGSTFLNPLQGPFDATQMFHSLRSKPRYKGNIMTDILFALSDMTDNWGYLQSQLIFKEHTLPWAKGEDLDALSDNLVFGCNNDVMLQSGKGLMALRLNGVQHAKLSNIEIYNLFDETALGSQDCGEYSRYNDGGHIAQKEPMQVGFSGNTVQGIVLNAADQIKLHGINIHSIQSHTGDAIGLSVWPSVNLVIEGDIMMDNIHSGWLIPDQINDLKWESRPNRAPMACGILNVDRFHSKQTGFTYVSNIKLDITGNYDTDIYVSNIYGFVYCDGSKDVKTMIGEYIGDGDVSMGLDDHDGDGDNEVDDDWRDVGGDDHNVSVQVSKAGDTLLIGTIIACSILFCGFVTMGYVAYIYCQHKRQEKDTERRAQLLLLNAQQHSRHTVYLQNAETRSNYHSFQFNADGALEARVEEKEPNERTSLIAQMPAFNRLNL